MTVTTCKYHEAVLHGNLGGPWVEVKQSDVVKHAGQVGVFLKSAVGARHPLTWYACYIKRKDKVGKNNLFTMECGKESAFAVGIRKLACLEGRGVAQLANDALCVRLTQRENNCDFIDFNGKVYLVSRRDIV